MQQFFEYAETVEQAIKNKKPIVALESALIARSLPYPKNLETIKTLEQIAQENDITLAIIAIVRGKIKIGLKSTELETLFHEKPPIKVSTRDLPYALSQALDAVTTVSAAAFCADSAGIRILATGGIGGVHRGNSHDISADLIELARTPIAIVTSGLKAILDVPETLEFLETYGVPIVGYRTDFFPAFYTSHSSFPVTVRINNLPSMNKLLKSHWQLGIPSSILIANPIPKEDEIPADIMETAVIEALRLAEEKQITGKDITPFLLNEVDRATSGLSQETCIKLLNNNLKLAAMLAHNLSTS